MANHLAEATLWYYLGHRTGDSVTAQIAESIDPMNAEARRVGFPVEWTSNQAIAWATVCRLYIISKQYLGDARKHEFTSLCRGCSASIRPRSFFERAFKRVVGNVTNLSLPNRKTIDSVADTFAIASMNYMVPESTATAIHPSVLEWVVTDELIHTAALLAITPENWFWNISVTEY